MYINQGHLPAQFISVIDFTDKPVIHYDAPVVEHTSVDDCR